MSRLENHRRRLYLAEKGFVEPEGAVVVVDSWVQLQRDPHRLFQRITLLPVQHCSLIPVGFMVSRMQWRGVIISTWRYDSAWTGSAEVMLQNCRTRSEVSMKVSWR